MSRPVGLLVMPYLLLELYRHPSLTRREKILCGLSPLIGFGLYLLFMYWQTGEFFAGFAAQRSFLAHHPC